MKTRRLTALSRRTMLAGLTTLPVFLARAVAPVHFGYIASALDREHQPRIRHAGEPLKTA